MTIYLDNNATTPVAPAVLQAALPYLQDHFGNASSAHHKGHEAKAAMNKARQQVAVGIGAASHEIIFTSGGSESNNMVLKGIFLAPDQFCRGHLIISAFEHAAIMQPALYLQRLGVQLTIIGCSSEGVINPQDIATAIRPDTRLVSIMHANNEIGTLQPLADIASICRQHGVPLHSDAAQSIGKTEVNVDRLGVDFLTMAGHKFYAPKGVGALYMRSGQKLTPLIQGVGHEHQQRAGTENVAYQVALGAAMQMVVNEGPSHWPFMQQNRDLLFALLRQGIGQELTQNGAMEARLPNTLSVNFPQVTGAALLAACPTICASTSAACHSGQSTQTVTQKAIGLPPEIAAGTVRLSLGWHTTKSQVEEAAAMLIAAYHRLRG